jgi:Skp family chaperone for outer membrane proteins
MKSWLTLAVAVALAFSSAVVAQTAQPAKIGPVAWISAQRILNESTAGKAGLRELQEFQQKHAADIRALQQKLDETRQQLSSADAAGRGPLLTREQEERTAVERATSQAQVDFQALQRQVNSELMRKVKAILDDLLRDQDVQVVMSAETAVIWARPNLDLTDKVLARLNAPSQPATGAGTAH